MENLKNHLNLIIKTYADTLMSFFMYWLMQTPLKSLDEAYLLFIAGTIVVLFTFIVIGIPLVVLSFSIEALFCQGETFLEKWKYRMEKRKTRMPIIQKEWPNSFLYRYLNQLHYMMVFFMTMSSILSKSASLLWIGFPSLILIIVRDKRIKKKFNYELYANKDIALNLIAIYIAIFLMIHYLVNHSLK